MRVQLKREIDNSYDIVIGSNLFQHIITDLKRNNYTHNLIITDSNVRKLYGSKLLAELKKNNITASLISFKAGEKNKNIDAYKELSRKCFDLGLDRNSLIIALGGGVTGDIAGFVASTYMRGIDYLQIPTTLLAQVDSSIGGKVGIDLKNGKNILGAFHQPKKVYIDINFLKTLPPKEIKTGLVEMIKHSIINDKIFFEYLEKNIGSLLNLSPQHLINSIARSCHIKSSIVQKDEKESNLRIILNLGHTIGHALETASSYKLTHGEAIAIGIVLESKISHNLGHLSENHLSRIFSLLNGLGLSPSPPKLNPKKIIRLMAHDKKSFNKKIKFILPVSIGKVIVSEDVPLKSILGVLG